KKQIRETNNTFLCVAYFPLTIVFYLMVNLLKINTATTNGDQACFVTYFTIITTLFYYSILLPYPSIPNHLW
ncbi:TPA: hypothetical protein ACRRIT_003024, partial [Enterococcus faecium]